MISCLCVVSPQMSKSCTIYIIQYFVKEIISEVYQVRESSYNTLQLHFNEIFCIKFVLQDDKIGN